MHFTLGLSSALLLSLFSPIFASPVAPSDNVPTKTTGNGNDPSLTLGASGAAGSYYCVSPRDHPDWAGPIKLDDCQAAYDAISNGIRDQQKVLTFWSAIYRSTPPPNSFKLPWGATRGTCTLVLRIGREFGNHVLPLDYSTDFADASNDPIEGRSDWFSMLIQWRIDLLPRCVAQQRKPGWEPLPHRIGFALALPSTSEMARQWGVHPGLVGGSNDTSLGLVEVS